MPIINRIADFHDDMTGWRRDLHRHPETAFEEQRTSDLVAEQLAAFGIDVHRGLATTGVVGTLKNGDGPAIGLRADMDALHIHELNAFDHRSVNDGKMHACGHDGHTAMLLGAARYLAETKRFNGTVHFIFQPAEENEGGARVMIEEGLFDRFPVKSVYGMHNQPGLDVGKMAIRSGPAMAAFDVFTLTVTGRGAHGAMPHLGVDPIVIAAEIVGALQTIASRTTDPLDSVVVSVTQFHSGDTWNVIPESAVLAGTARSFRAEVQATIEPTMRRIAEGIAAAHDATVELVYEERYPATFNHAAETEVAANVAGTIVDPANVDLDPAPCMGSEDFAFMLQKTPGSYIFIGNGPGESGCMLHNPHYDFNDDILPIGASYWANLVESELT